VGLSDAPKDQFNPLIQGIEDIKENVYTKPFQKELGTISGKAGELAGEVAQFTAPSTAIIKGQELALGAYKATDIAKRLASGGIPSKVANYVAQKGQQAVIEALGTGGTIFGTSGGDTGQAVGAGIGAGLLSSLTHVGTDAFKSLIPQTVKENVSKVFGLTGKKSLTGIAEGTSADQAGSALTTISKLSPNIIVTDINGVEKRFNPLEATFAELPQALSQAKNLVYNSYTDLAKKAGEVGGSFTARDFYKVLDDLDKYDGVGYTPAFSTKANQLKEAIKRFIITDEKTGATYFAPTKPEAIQTLIENINKDVNPLSDKAGAQVAQETSQKLRALMDDKITKATGNPEYQKLRDAYSQLKSIENETVAYWKKAMKQAGARPDLIDGIATIDGLMGILTMNPDQLARAGLTEVVKNMYKYFRNPEVNLRRVFKLIQEGESSVKPSSRFGGVNLESPTAKKGASIVNETKALPNKQGGFINPSSLADSPLLKEARKYKTAEEFVKAQGTPVFRGQSHEGFTAFDGGNKQRFLPDMKGTSFSMSKESAQNYGDKIIDGIVDNKSLLKPTDIKPEILQTIKSEIKKLTYDDYVDGTGFENVVSKLTDIAKKQNKGSIKLTDFFPKSKIDAEIRVLNKESFKTKSQLTSIWEKANKK
jgi:hypothetical protein